MKNNVIISALFLFMAVILFPGCRNNSKSETLVKVEPTAEQLRQKGEYLVTIMGCNDCHSPKQNGPQGPMVIAATMLSGYPADRPLQKADRSFIKTGWLLFNEDLTEAVGPWGVSFSANITSDQSGIGNWPEENFKRALKEGKYKGIENSRTLLPPMPWTNFGVLSDEDVKSIYTYLLSIKPVRNVVPLAIGPEDKI